MVNTTVSQSITDDFDLPVEFSPHLTRNSSLSRDLDAHVARIERIIQIRPIALESVPTHLGLNRDSESGQHHCQKAVEALVSQGKAIVCGSPLMVWAPDKAPKPRKLFSVASATHQMRIVVDPSLAGSWKPSPARLRAQQAKLARQEQAAIARQQADQERSEMRAKLSIVKPGHGQATRDRILEVLESLEEKGQPFDLNLVCDLAKISYQNLHKTYPDLIRKAKELEHYDPHLRPSQSRREQAEKTRLLVNESIKKLETGEIKATSIKEFAAQLGFCEQTITRSLDLQTRKRMKAAIARCKQALKQEK